MKHIAITLLALLVSSMCIANDSSASQDEKCYKVTITNNLNAGVVIADGQVCHPVVYANGYRQNQFFMVPEDSLTRYFQSGTKLTLKDMWNNSFTAPIYVHSDLTVNCQRKTSIPTCTVE